MHTYLLHTYYVKNKGIRKFTHILLVILDGGVVDDVIFSLGRF